MTMDQWTASIGLRRHTYTIHHISMMSLLQSPILLLARNILWHLSNTHLSNTHIIRHGKMYVCHIIMPWYVCMYICMYICMYVISCFGMYVRHIMLWYVCTSYYYTLLIKIKIKINRTGNILRPYLHCILIYDHHVHQILASCPTFYQSTLFIHKTFLFVFVFT